MFIFLDTKNLCNDVSGQKHCQIVAVNFLELEVFTDLLYKDPGLTDMKKSDGALERQSMKGFFNTALYPNSLLAVSSSVLLLKSIESFSKEFSECWELKQTR